MLNFLTNVMNLNILKSISVTEFYMIILYYKYKNKNFFPKIMFNI